MYNVGGGPIFLARLATISLLYEKEEILSADAA